MKLIKKKLNMRFSLFTKLHSWDRGRHTPSWRCTSWSQRTTRSTHCSLHYPWSSPNAHRSGTPTSTSCGTQSSTMSVGRCCPSCPDSDFGESIPEVVRKITWCIWTTLCPERHLLTYNGGFFNMHISSI